MTTKNNSAFVCFLTELDALIYSILKYIQVVLDLLISLAMLVKSLDGYKNYNNLFLWQLLRKHYIHYLNQYFCMDIVLLMVFAKTVDNGHKIVGCCNSRKYGLVAKYPKVSCVTKGEREW